MSLTPPLFSSPDDLPVDLFPFDFEPMIPFDEEGGVTIVEDNYIEVAQKRMSTENGHAFKSNLSVAANKARELIAQARSSIYNSQILKSEIHRIVRDFSISANYFYTHCNSYSQGKKIHAERSLEIQDSIANGRGDFKPFARPSREKTEASTTVASSFGKKKKIGFAMCMDAVAKDKVMEHMVVAEGTAAIVDAIGATTNFVVKSICLSQDSIDLKKPVYKKGCQVALDLAHSAGEKIGELTKKTIQAVGAQKVVEHMTSTEHHALSQRLAELDIPEEQARQYAHNAFKTAGSMAGAYVGGVAFSVLKRTGSTGFKIGVKATKKLAKTIPSVKNVTAQLYALPGLNKLASGIVFKENIQWMLNRFLMEQQLQPCTLNVHMLTFPAKEETGILFSKLPEDKAFSLIKTSPKESMPYKPFEQTMDNLTQELGKLKRQRATLNYQLAITQQKPLLDKIAATTPRFVPPAEFAQHINKFLQDSHKYIFSYAGKGKKLNVTLLFQENKEHVLFTVFNVICNRPNLIQSVKINFEERLEYIVSQAFAYAQKRAIPAQKIILAFEAEQTPLALTLNKHGLTPLGIGSFSKGVADKPLTLIELVVPKIKNPIEVEPLPFKVTLIRNTKTPSPNNLSSAASKPLVGFEEKKLVLSEPKPLVGIEKKATFQQEPLSVMQEKLIQAIDNWGHLIVTEGKILEELKPKISPFVPPEKFPRNLDQFLRSCEKYGFFYANGARTGKKTFEATLLINSSENHVLFLISKEIIGKINNSTARLHTLIKPTALTAAERVEVLVHHIFVCVNSKGIKKFSIAYDEKTIPVASVLNKYEISPKSLGTFSGGKNSKDMTLLEVEQAPGFNPIKIY